MISRSSSSSAPGSTCRLRREPRRREDQVSSMTAWSGGAAATTPATPPPSSEPRPLRRRRPRHNSSAAPPPAPEPPSPPDETTPAASALRAARSRRCPSRSREGARLHSTHGRDRHASCEDGPREMLKGGVIMDVVDADQRGSPRSRGCRVRRSRARPADSGLRGVARMSIRHDSEIQDGVSIPVMAKCRIGHFVEAQILGRSRSTTSTSPSADAGRRGAPRRQARLPVRRLRATNLGEAVRRIAEGAR